MPAVQTVFNDTFTEGYPGMVANGETSNRISRTIEDAAGVAFGKAVYRGSGDHGCTATPGAAGFLGITIADKGVPKFTGAQAADTFPQYHNVPIMSEGVIWVLAGENVADGEPVFVTPAGAFMNDNGGGANFALPGWVFDMTRASGTPVRITNKRNIIA